jgi:hypothetical protein
MYESSSFVQYKAVNEAFAEKIASIWKEGDVSECTSSHTELITQISRQFGLMTTIFCFCLNFSEPTFQRQRLDSSYMWHFQARKSSGVFQVKLSHHRYVKMLICSTSSSRTSSSWYSGSRSDRFPDTFLRPTLQTNGLKDSFGRGNSQRYPTTDFCAESSRQRAIFPCRGG